MEMAAGAKPVPVSVVEPDVAPEALTVTVAGPSAIAADGVNVAVNVHVLPVATAAVQPFVTLKSDAFVPVTAIEGTPEGRPPVLVTVNDWALLVVPTVSEPKSCEAGAMVNAAGDAPVPESATLAMSPPGSLAVSVADRAPAFVGAKSTSSVHFPAGASGLPEQPSLDFANCDASAPPSATVMAPVGLPPPFDSVNVVAADMEPVPTVPKLCEDAENAMLAGEPPCEPPVPLRATSTEPPGVALTASVALAAPLFVGAKCTAIVHVPFEGRELPLHPSLSITNALLSAPETLVAIVPDASWPVFVIVTIDAALLDPTATLPNASFVELPLSSAKPGVFPISKLASTVPPPLEDEKHPAAPSGKSAHTKSPDPQLLDAMCPPVRRRPNAPTAGAQTTSA
jgi:hypothetical protein